MSPRTEWRFNATSWVLFPGSAVFFTWSAVRAGEWIGVVASLLFLIASLFFLVPV